MKKILFALCIAVCLVGCGKKEIDLTNDVLTESKNSENVLENGKDYFSQTLSEIEKEDEGFYSNPSLSQVELNSKSGEILVKYDELLNNIYKYLQENMAEEEFNKLKVNEEEWIKNKEKAVEEAAKEWEGGSGEQMIRNSVAMDYTSKRCYYLISLIDELKYVDKPYEVKSVSPTGFAGSSLNMVKLFSNGDVYLLQFDGAGYEDSNIIKNELIAKNVVNISVTEEGNIAFEGENMERVEGDYAWIDMQ